MNMTNDEILNEIEDCRRSLIAKILGVTTVRVNSFVEEGVSWYKPETQTCNLVDAVHWYLRIKSGEESTLKQKKMEMEIAVKEAQVNKINDTVIDRSEHEKILCSRAASMRQFMEQTAMLNATRFVDLTLDQARGQILQLLGKAVDAYCGEGNSVEQDVLDLS